MAGLDKPYFAKSLALSLTKLEIVTAIARLPSRFLIFAVLPGAARGLTNFQPVSSPCADIIPDPLSNSKAFTANAFIASTEWSRKPSKGLSAEANDDIGNQGYVLGAVHQCINFEVGEILAPDLHFMRGAVLQREFHGDRRIYEAMRYSDRPRTHC